MEVNDSFDHILERFQQADLDKKIEIYTNVKGLTVEEYKELLRYFPIKYLGKLESAMV